MSSKKTESTKLIGAITPCQRPKKKLYGSAVTQPSISATSAQEEKRTIIAKKENDDLRIGFIVNGFDEKSILCISAMMPVALFSSFFWTENASLPVGREDRNAQLSIVRQLYSCLFY
jgi:hypothetical protein